MATIGATQARVGTALYIDGKLCEVLEYNHIKPGKGPAKVRVRVKFLKDGRVVEYTVGINDKFESTELKIKDMQYLYRQGADYVCMDTESFEQVQLPAELLGGQAQLIKEEATVAVTFDGNRAVALRLPSAVALKVTQTLSAVRGNTATNATKEARVETGYKLQVPLFIAEGDLIRIDTRSGKYIERA